MGHRREERAPIALRALVWGVDTEGKLFVTQAQTLDISPTGGRLQGLDRELELGAVIGVQHGDNRGRFRVVWVGKPGTPQAGQAGIRCIALGQRSAKSVLYLEDQDHEREHRASLLQTCGYDVVTAVNGRAAQELIQTRSFDAVVLDHPLLDVDCEEFLRRVKHIQHRTRIVVLSAFPAMVPEPVMELADAFVHKGESHHKLICAIEEMIGPGTQVRWPITRCDQRHAVIMPLTIQVIRGGVASNLPGRAKDLSESGMGVTLEGDLVPGEIVTAVFSLPTATEVFRIHATVRRRTSSDYGLAFVDITADQQQAIRALCGVLPALETLQDCPVSA